MHSSKVMLITGASRGIGAATARLAQRAGYTVVINYRQDHTAAQQLKDELSAHGGQAIAIQADISRENDIVELFTQVDQHFGRLDVLVNNAAILELQTRVDAIGSERLERVFRTNVIGAFLCCREAVRRMSTRYGGHGGSIVNVSSAASRLGSAGEYVDYAASKGAIDTLTIGLAREVAAESIRVNAVRPGFIYTQMHASGGEPDRVARLEPTLPMQRGGEPSEVAQAILWLASDLASYVTGSFVEASGGR